MNHTETINAVLEQFDLPARVVDAVTGPSISRYEVELGPGVHVNRVLRLQPNIAYATGCESVRINLVPSKSAIGVELPNAQRQTVALTFRDGHPLQIPVGQSIDGEMIYANLGQMPHLLVAGSTGSGKSCFINAMLVTLLRNDPREVRLMLIDPKLVELTPYNGVPHLLRQVVTEVQEAAVALDQILAEMESRYQKMQEAGVRNIDGLDLPYIVVVIDELADLVMTNKTIPEKIIRLTQKARAAGIHLVLATQRPSVDVISGLLKANVPSRLAFACATATDSRVILDEGGAEQLLGKGDGLFRPIGARTGTRIQSPYVSDEEVEQAVRGAMARGRVETKVHQWDEPEGPTVLDFIASLRDDMQSGLDRAANHIEALCHKGTFFDRRGPKFDVMANTPKELGALADRMEDAIKRVSMLYDEVVLQNQDR